MLRRLDSSPAPRATMRVPPSQGVAQSVQPEGSKREEAHSSIKAVGFAFSTPHRTDLISVGAHPIPSLLANKAGTTQALPRRWARNVTEVRVKAATECSLGISARKQPALFRKAKRVPQID